jgi:competence ComEA-like helix-hairpin-helix protein
MAAAYHTPRRPPVLWQSKGMVRWVSLVFLASSAVTLLAAQDAAMPEGKGKDTLQHVCTNCHGLDQVTSLRYSKKYWGSVVDDMVSRGAEASDDDLNLIVSYLARNFGKPVNINSATEKEIQDGLSFPAAQAEAIVKYRTGNGPFQSFEDLQKVPGLSPDLLAEEKKNIAFN